MYIAPNSTIKVLRNVPFDNTYKNTRLWNNKTAQTNYFSSIAKYTFTEQTYQRVNRGVIRLGISADDIYDCNYVMFQNTSYGTKWFYAFITSVEYVNNSVCDVTYEIDVMQTWFFDYTLGQCYVEREHTAAGDTLSYYTDENIDPGEYMRTQVNSINLSNMNVVILYKVSSSITPANMPVWYTGNNIVACGLMANVPCTAADVKAAMVTINTTGGEIISMYCYPSVFYNANNDPGICDLKYVTLNRPSSLDGYTPKNKKLLYAPYSVIQVTDNNKVNTYYYEDFTDPNNLYTFCVEGVYIPQVSICAYPTYYKNVVRNLTEKIIIDDFPVCAFSNDSFSQWWNLNSVKLYTNMLSSLTSGAVGLFSPMPLYGIAGVASTGLSTLGDMATAIRTPNNVGGNLSSTNLLAGINGKHLIFANAYCRSERAMQIDDYFTKYGYACKRIKVPNRDVRPRWCYCKTNAAIIRGSIPADDMNKICKIYDEGITFWKYGAVIGDYSADNSVVEG